MDLITQLAGWIIVPTMAFGSAWLTVRFLKRRQARHQTQRITRALSVSHAIFTALEHVPDGIINRDLRRGLVMLVAHQLEVLRLHNPHHAHLGHLQTRVNTLNRIPSGLQSSKLRDRASRRHATAALAALAKILKEAQARKEIDQRSGALAHASALFASQQIAVDSARQAANDAENIRAYRRALDFARQAKALANQLPPLIRGTLSTAIDNDIERLENLTNPMARI